MQSNLKVSEGAIVRSCLEVSEWFLERDIEKLAQRIRERGREEQCLARSRQQTGRENGGEVLAEVVLEQSVRLVEHEEADAREVELRAAADVVRQSTCNVRAIYNLVLFINF